MIVNEFAKIVVYLFFLPSHALKQGQVRLTLGQAKASDLALDPMRARPGHEISGLTLAILGSGWVGSQANQAWPCPWTVTVHLVLQVEAKIQDAGLIDIVKIMVWITLCGLIGLVSYSRLLHKFYIA